MKRDKIFIIAAAVFAAVIMICCPVLRGLQAAGAIQLSDIGAKGENENTYSGFLSAPLNAVENVKTEIRNIYTNFLPGYGAIIRMENGFTTKMNVAASDMWNLLLTRNDTPPVTDPVTEPGTDPVTGIPGDSDSVTAEPETDAVTEPPEAVICDIFDSELELDIMSHKTTFIGEDSLHRFYKIEVTYEDGSTAACMESAIKQSESKLRSAMRRRVSEDFNRIADATPEDVGLYLFIESRFQDFPEFETYMNGEEQSTAELRDEFLSLLSDRYTTTYFDISTMERNMLFTFRTDPHWTAQGLYYGYSQIIRMIEDSVPGIGNPRPYGTYHSFDDIVYYGANSRRIMYRDIADIFMVTDYDLPRHTMTDLYQVKDFDRQLDLYMSGRYSTSPSTDHYETFFPRPKSVSYPDNDTGRNILLICDSYMWAGGEVLASNFDNLYIFYPWEYTNFDYNGFIEKNDITDVLVMQFSDRLMFNIYGDSKLFYVVTK